MKDTETKWTLSPRVNRYKIASENPIEVSLLQQRGKEYFTALSIGGGVDNHQIAIIPLDESNEENARLIVAAPEMKLELEKVINSIQLGEDIDQDSILLLLLKL